VQHALHLQLAAVHLGAHLRIHPGPLLARLGRPARGRLQLAARSRRWRARSGLTLALPWLLLLRGRLGPARGLAGLVCRLAGSEPTLLVARAPVLGRGRLAAFTRVAGLVVGLLLESSVQLIA